MSHAFIPPDLPGHENTPLVLQLVANYIVEKLFVVSSRNLLHMKQDEFFQCVTEIGLVQYWDTSHSRLPVLTGTLSMTNKWLYHSMKRIVDMILAAHSLEQRPFWHHCQGSITFSSPTPLTLAVLHDICSKTRILRLSRRLNDENAMDDDKFEYYWYFIQLEYAPSNTNMGMEWIAESQQLNTWPGLKFKTARWPVSVLRSLKRNRIHVEKSFTWEDLQRIMSSENYQMWETHKLKGTCEVKPGSYTVETIGDRVRLNDILEFSQAVQSHGCTITNINLTGNNGLPPSLFTIRKRKLE